MSRASLSSGAFSHTPPGLWIAEELDTANLIGCRQAHAERESCQDGEVDQATRSETEMELVQNARERCSQDGC